MTVKELKERAKKRGLKVSNKTINEFAWRTALLDFISEPTANLG
jgi:hypothetical protein